MKWSPHPYQIDAMLELASNKNYGLLLSPGSGKTSVTLAYISSLLKAKAVKKVLVICPLRVTTVWQEEAAFWDEFNHLRIVVVHGPKKEKLLQQEADIYVVTFDGLQFLANLTGKTSFNGKLVIDPEKWKTLGFDTLVIDELNRMKRPSSTRFKTIKKVLHTFDRRVGLTGSPATNGLLDLWGQIYCLDQGNALGRYVTHYRNKYFMRGYMPWDIQLRPGAEQEIFEAIEPIVMRLDSSEYTGLPELTDTYVRVDLPPDARAAYRDMERKMLMEIDSEEITAANAAVKIGKCLQIAGGAVYFEDGVHWADVHEEKINALIDLVGELQGSPLFVAYAYRHELTRLQQALGNVPYIGDGVSLKATKRIIDSWNRGEIPVLLSHPGSSGHGLNMQKGGCYNVCFFSPTWDYDLYSQMIARVHRQGNKAERVFVHHIVARDTVDELVIDTLKRKEEGQQALFNALLELRRRRVDG